MLIKITGDYSSDPTVFMDLARKLSEGQLNEDKMDDLMAALDGHARNVVGDGRFFTVSQFGSGYDVSNPLNVTDYLKKEMAIVDKDSQYYEDLEMDLEAAEQIAAVITKMGGKVSDISPGEGDTPDLEFRYTVNDKGDLIGQAI